MLLYLAWNRLPSPPYGVPVMDKDASAILNNTDPPRERQLSTLDTTPPKWFSTAAPDIRMTDCFWIGAKRGRSRNRGLLIGFKRLTPVLRIRDHYDSIDIALKSIRKSYCSPFCRGLSQRRYPMSELIAILEDNYNTASGFQIFRQNTSKFCKCHIYLCQYFEGLKVWENTAWVLYVKRGSTKKKTRFGTSVKAGYTCKNVSHAILPRNRNIIFKHAIKLTLS